MIVYPEEILRERIKELEAENARLREEVQSLTDELAYHGIYPRRALETRPMTNHIYGPNGHIVDAFIEHLKGMTEAQWVAAGDAARDAARDAAGDAAENAAWDAAGDAAGDAAEDAARDAARDAAGNAAWAAAWAANEIQGADLLRERGIPFYFLPLFGFADEQAVLASRVRRQDQ